MLKRCCKCKVCKHTEMFNRDNSRPDKLQSWCKACRSEYYKQPKYKKIKKDYRRSMKGKKAQRRSYEKNKNASISVRRFNNKIQSGKILKVNKCSQCKGESPLVEAHHDDYNYPYKIRWLCKSCHVAWHKEHKPKNADYGIFNKKG